MTKFIFFTGLTFLLLINISSADEIVRQDNKSVTKQLESFVLEAQFSGPHQDTIVQRWADKAKGNICYFYIPVTIPTLQISQDKNNLPSDNSQSKRTPKVYGSNNIGAMSCVSAK